jgi:hypothetical protein
MVTEWQNADEAERERFQNLMLIRALGRPAA